MITHTRPDSYLTGNFGTMGGTTGSSVRAFVRPDVTVAWWVEETGAGGRGRARAGGVKVRENYCPGQTEERNCRKARKTFASLPPSSRLRWSVEGGTDRGGRMDGRE